MKKKINTSAFVRPLSLIGLVLCGFGLLLAIFAFGAPLAFAQRSSPNQRNDGAPVPKSKAPLLTMENAPDLPQCRGVLNQEIVDLVNSASEDPAVVFERNRREHPHMIAMPPTTDCASALWRTIRDKGVAKPSVDANSINLRQYMPYSVFNSAPLAALIGTNINLSNGVEGYQGETNIAINPNNPLQLVAHSNTFFKDTTAQCQSPTGGTANTFGSMALFGSTDGGATWKYNCAPWHTGATGGVPGATAWFGSDPALAWDNQGRAYATYMLLSQSSSSNGVSIVVARSTDSGQSWAQFGNPVVNRITATTALDDKEFMAIDNTSGQAHSFPGRIYVVWDEGNVERVAFSDTGATWTTVLLPSGTAAIGGNLVVAADGTVYLVWTRYNVETIVFSKSIDGGANWTAPVVIATNALQSFGSNNHPPAQDQRGINGFASIDVDRNPASAFFGYVYVAYNDFPSGTTSGPDLNVYTVRSTDGGTNWSTRVKVNDDNWGASQFFPWLAVDQSDGSVNVSWVDSRIDPINRKTQAVYARSVNGGASYEANLLVHDNGAQWRNNVNYSDENAVDNPTFNGNQYGDYTGIVASNRQVHPLWTDSRSYFPLADTQAPTRREDNATSTITNCSAPSAVAPPSVNSSATPSVAVTWAAPAGWGTNATDGTYSVYRNTTSVFPAGAALTSGLTATSYVDTTGVANTTYFYFVRAKNNCSGTALTAMTSDSGASASVVYGSTGTATGMLQGTVTAAGNGNPLGNVVVFAGTLSATTNGSGFYQIPAINAGSYTVSSSPAGYMAGSVNGVTVSGGATKVQNLALTPNAANNCFTDTNFGDFSTGAGTNADIASTPGSVKLANSGGEAADQVSSPSSLFIGNTPTATTWSGQTFQAGTTGTLTKISVALGLNSGSTGALTVEIRDVSGANPGSTVLATGTLGPVTNVGTAAIYTTTFASPAAVVSGTSYSVVLKGNSGSVFSVIGNTSSLPNGQFLTTTTSGSSWTAMPSSDLDFTTFVTSPVTYQTSGNFVSSTKDSGAVVGTTPTWTTLSWNNVALPAGTNLRFQAAASNSATGPFNFVGPDNTAATFFSSGGSLAQFNGNRYLQYKALLTTSNTSNTPTLNDVTVCSADLVPPILTSASSRQLHAGGAGTFDLPLSLSGRTIEPRSDGAGNHTIVLAFDKPVTAGSASVTSGTGTPASPSFSGNTMIVSLSGVTDMQAVTVQVSNVTGPGEATLSSASVIIGFLYGDVNGDSTVNAADTTLVRNNSGVTLSNTNFLTDVNVDGFVNAADTTVARNGAGHFIP